VTFIAPFAFGLAALAAPIVILYMLRSRRSRTPVSSLMLWSSGQQNVSANAPWQPLRFSWLLLLQLLALMLLVLAVARPARPTTAPLADHTVLIVDTSASMQAADGSTTRLERARRKALEAVSQLGPGRRMSVVEAGPQARVVLSGSSDRRALVEAVSSLRPTDGVSDAAGAFALGSSLEEPDVSTILLFYSDGGVRPEDRAEAPGNLVHIPIGDPAGNVGITRIAAAPKGAGWDVFVHVVNSGSARIDGTLAIAANAQTLISQPLRLDPQASRDVALSLGRGVGPRIEARLSNIRAAPGTAGRAAVNALPTDDVARAVLDASTRTRVLLVTPGNDFLSSLLKAIPGTTLTVAATSVPARGYTLAIYDRAAPPPTVEAPSLVIASPSGAPGVAVTGSLTRPVVTFVAPREQIMSQVDLSRLAVRRAQKIVAPSMRTLVAAGDDPLLVAGVPGGRRLAYLAFDLRESNLPVQVAFPLLFSNLVSWLTQGEGPDRGALVAGDPLPLRVPGRADRVVVSTPSGDDAERAAAGATFDETDRAGFYRARYLAGSAGLGEDSFAVNVPSLETNLSPKPVTGKLAERGATGGRLAGLRAWGPGILAAALLVLLAEWWVAHGRPTRRRRYTAIRPTAVKEPTGAAR
jgi:aerotolerance regulator-like protein/VWA domain-containing protein